MNLGNRQQLSKVPVFLVGLRDGALRNCPHYVVVADSSTAECKRRGMQGGVHWANPSVRLRPGIECLPPRYPHVFIQHKVIFAVSHSCDANWCLESRASPCGRSSLGVGDIVTEKPGRIPLESPEIATITVPSYVPKSMQIKCFVNVIFDGLRGAKPHIKQPWSDATMDPAWLEPLLRSLH